MSHLRPVPRYATVRAMLFKLIDLRDAFAIVGLLMLGYGIAQIYPPAAWITVGTVLLALGLRG